MSRIVGVILAGGAGSRMGGLNKPLLSAAGRPLIEHVVANAGRQVEQLVVSINRAAGAFDYLNLPLVRDVSAARKGPLVGIYSAMQWYVEREVRADFMACFPGDVPAFPENLVATLLESLVSSDGPTDIPVDDTTVAWCQTGEQIQPLFSLWPTTCLHLLRNAIARGIHGPKLYFQLHSNRPVRLSPPEAPLFMNINTPEDLILADRLLPGVGSPAG